MILDCGGRILDLGRVAIMGIVNVTPDSFSDGGHFFSTEQAIAQGLRLVDEGADLLDVGGESTRPGAASVTSDEEMQRVVPVIEALASRISVPISVDTSKPVVMRAAVAAGAGFINDVRALREPGALDTAAGLTDIPICLMHMQGEPGTMQLAPVYRNVVDEVRDFLAERIAACTNAGIARERLVIDPGFGFGKSHAHNLALLRHLATFSRLGVPLLAGLSRKSLIQAVLGLPVTERMPASVGLACFAVLNGVRILRVHDVASTRQAIRMIEAIQE